MLKHQFKVSINAFTSIQTQVTANKLYISVQQTVQTIE